MKTLTNLDCLNLNIHRFPCETVGMAQVISDVTLLSDFAYLNPHVVHLVQGGSDHYLVQGVHAKKGAFKFTIRYRRGGSGEFGKMSWTMRWEGGRMDFGSGLWAYVLDSARVDTAQLGAGILELNCILARLDEVGVAG